MKRILLFAATALLSINVNAKSALVVIAHGSPSNEWNAAVLALEDRLQNINIPGISYKRVALMEFSRPDIADVIKDCEHNQIDTVFALPLFISPSGHSEDDIPNILGLKYNPKIRTELKEEGTAMVKTGMHIITGPTLMESGVIENAMTERIKALSDNKQNEAVIFLAHGDPDRKGFWETILEGCVAKAKEAGFTYIDYQLIGMGQNIKDDITPLLRKANEAKQKVIVQGIYLVSTVNSMAKSAGLQDESIVFGSEGILPLSTEDVLDWIVNTTKEWTAEKQPRR